MSGIDEVLITAELASRPSRTPDYEAENRALGLLAQEMATDPRRVLQKCAELVMELCHADSAGISILEPGGAGGMLRWQAAAGAFAPNLHGTMPQEASPCGTVMERDCVLLFKEAERFFPALQGFEPRIYENLLTPWHSGGKAVGTLWAVKHSPAGRFDAEDARLLQSLAHFAAAAFQMHESEQALASDLANAERLRSLSERLVSEDSLQAIYEEVLSATIAIARADAGTVQIYDPATKSLELIASQNFSCTITDYFHRVDGGSRTACGIALQTGACAFVDFPKEVADHGCQLLVGEGILSAVAYPLMSRTGAPLGMLNAHWRHAGHRSNDRELRFLGLLARQAADLIEQRQSQNALRESDARLAQLADAAPVLIWETGEKGATFVNSHYLAYFGVSFEEIAGFGWARFIHPDDVDGYVAAYQQAFAARRRYDYECRLLRADGEYRWHRTSGGPASNGRFIGSSTDLHDLVMAERALRESEERQAFLLKLSDILRPLADPADIQGETTHLLRERLDAGWCYYVDWDLDRSAGLVLRDSTRAGLPSLAGAHDVSDAEEFLQLLARGTVLTVSDYANYEHLPARIREDFVRRGFRSMMMAPLVKEDRLTATLLVGDTEVRDWSAGDASLLVEVAERTWAAVERAGAEAALRVREADLARVQRTGQVGGLDVDIANGLTSRRSPEYLRLHGLPQDGRIESHGDWLARVHPEDRDAAERALFDALEGDDTSYESEYRIVRPDDGAVRWIAARADVERDAEGKPVRLVGAHVDITEQKRAQTALRDSEERFRQFANASAGGLWIRDADRLSMEFVSAAVGTIYGLEPDALLGDVKRWATMILPEDRERALEHLEKARRGETVVHEFRIQRSTDGAFRWIRNTDFPLRDNGNISRIGGIAEDVTETKLAVEHQGVLLAELQHRVRNIMAMIRSMARRSSDGAADVSEYKDLLEGRLLALARVQALLTRHANSGGSLRDIVESEVEAQAHHGGQFELIGPDVQLSPKAVEVLTLALHELSTNALKYGALSVPEGRLRVEWSPFEKRGRTWLAIDWVETGAPSRGPVTRRGFGSDLIEGKIPYELGGTGRIVIEPGGARCHLEFPLKEGESILETDAPSPTTVFGGTLDMTGAPDLTGRNVLVVEDDYYIAGDTAAALRGAGAMVLGPCPSEDATLDLLETATPTHAVLDLNLGGGGPRFEIAHALKERGVPFIFLTGYDPDAVPDDLADVVRLQKPVTFSSIVEAVAQL